jgi:pimeloyl-ACP methyl ester carboxylesterase
MSSTTNFTRRYKSVVHINVNKFFPLLFLTFVVLFNVSSAKAGAVRAGFNANPFPANNDDSTGAVDLGFPVNFFGTTYSSVYINNDGTISFDSFPEQWDPFSMGDVENPIIAPFWADVDTRGPGSGIVKYGVGTVDGKKAFGVTWSNVGYYFFRADKLNTFQVILIERLDNQPGAFDIEFNYDQIQWETGNDSGGTNGIGGNSARVGYSAKGQQVFLELPGSGVNGAFLDSNTTTGLIHKSRNSDVLGRYVFSFPVEPVIFVPGIMGSQLVGSYAGITTSYFPNIAPYFECTTPSVHNITLDVTHPCYKPDLYASDILTTAVFFPFYKPLIDFFKSKNYVYYDHSVKSPDKGECNINQKNNNLAINPSLFAFPYDWRRDNITSAQKLKTYIQCVQQFYPAGTKVNIVAHSMGGLITRRYILQQKASGQAHGLGKVITIASPFLGTPKATFKLYTGGSLFEEPGFSLLGANTFTVQWLAPFFPALHQLLPSRTYHKLRGGIIAEIDDINGNGYSNEVYQFGQVVAQLNTDFDEAGTYPGTVGAGFHDFAGQDDWKNDQSGIKYFHIFGDQKQLNTTNGLYVKYSARCRLSGNILPDCFKGRLYIPVKGHGDKTVPLVSTTMGWFGGFQGQPQFPDRAPPSMRMFTYISQSRNSAEELRAEHTGLTKNTDIQNLLAYLLGINPTIISVNGLYEVQRPAAIASQQETQSTNNSVLPQLDLSSYDPSYYLTIAGQSSVLVRDENGNTAAVENGQLRNDVEGLTGYESIGEDSVLLTLSTNHSYTVKFRTGATPVEIELVQGRGNTNPTSAVRYRNLSLPANASVQLTFSQNIITSFKHDADDNGTFETTIAPTANLSGAAAGDVTPPNVNIEITRQGGTATATITAHDAGSGINKIWYSLDGQTFEQYTSPVSIPYSSNHVKIEAFADDNAGNRSGLVARTVYSNVSVSGTISYGTTPADQTAKFIPDVTLTAAGASPVSAVTDAAGIYLLNNLTPNANYTVTPSKTGNINGITPFDATLILQCVAAGANCALTANQKLAANTNGDAYISPFDATLILRYVAANAQSLNTAQVGNWKFDPTARNYPLFSGMLSNENYFGYLIGDVNGSWTPFEFAAASSAPQIQISLPQNAAAVKDSNVFIPVSFSKSDSNVTVRSYSFHATFDPLVLQPHGIATSGTLSEGCSLAINRNTSGKIGVSASCPISAASGTLINLYFKVVGEANTSTGATPLTFLTTSEDNPTPWFEDTNNNPISTGLTNGQFTVIPPTAANSDDSILNEKLKDSSEGSAVSAKAFVPETEQQQQQQQPGAEGGIQISLPQNAAVTPGSVVTIPVTLTNSGEAQLSAYSFDVQFNPALLKAVEIIDTSGTLSSNCFVEANTITPGRINIAGSCGNSISASAGILVKLRFTVVGQANSAASEARTLRFWQTPVFEDSNGHQITVGRTNGSIR